VHAGLDGPHLSGDLFYSLTFERSTIKTGLQLGKMSWTVNPIGFVLLSLCVLLLVVRFGTLNDGSDSSRAQSAEEGSRSLAQSSKPENAQNKQRKNVHKQNYVPYSEAENVVKKVETKWGDFINFAPQPARTKPYIKSSVMKALQQCPTPTTPPVVCKEV